MQPIAKEPGRRACSPARLGGYDLNLSSHVCAFFSSAEEEYDVLMPFIKDGLDVGAKAFHTIDPARSTEHLDRLSSAAIDVNGCLRSGQLDVRTWRDVHLRGGTFDARATESIFIRALDDATDEGYSHTRFVSHMGWAAELNDASSHRLLEYESRACEAAEGSQPSQVICVYDLTLFSADVVLDVIRTHPLVLIGGTLYENPLFVPPPEFLRDLRERGHAADGPHAP